MGQTALRGARYEPCPTFSGLEPVFWSTNDSGGVADWTGVADAGMRLLGYFVIVSSYLETGFLRSRRIPLKTTTSTDNSWINMPPAI
jgi:hypothetical protein